MHRRLTVNRNQAIRTIIQKIESMSDQALADMLNVVFAGEMYAYVVEPGHHYEDSEVLENLANSDWDD